MKENTLLLITKPADDNHIGGRQLLSRINEHILKSIYGSRFIRHEINDASNSRLVKVARGLRGLVDGLSGDMLSEVVQLIKDEKVTQVFIDGSNLGVVAKVVKVHYPSLEVVTFYHNVETRFFLGALRRNMTPRALAVLLGNFFAERAATMFSDKRVCLNERDSSVLNKFFGAKATHISPMAVFRPEPSAIKATSLEIYQESVLFVGGNFYANLAGIRWYRRYISPHFSLPLYVVGHGYDSLRADLELPGKIIIVGSVDDLSSWYRRSKFVVAPILDGSGMKTKVAEALMYGKRIVGTPEAFVGYEATLPLAGWCCCSPEAFLEACQIADLETHHSVDEELIQIYEDNFSIAAAQRRFSEILVSK